MPYKPDKAPIIQTIYLHSGFKILLAGMMCLLLFSPAVLAGCSSTVPQQAIPPLSTGLPRNTETPQNTYKKPTQTTPAVTMKAARLSLFLDTMALSQDGLNLNLQAKIYNSNSFSINVDNIQLYSRDSSGAEKTLDTVTGGAIKAYSMNTYNLSAVLPKTVLFERKQTIGVSTQTMNADRTLPLGADVEIEMPEVLTRLIINPRITAQGNITGITTNGMLEAQVEGKIENRNPLDLKYNLIQILIKDKTGKAIAFDSFSSGSIAANSDYAFKRSLTLPVQVLNETGITFEAKTTIQIPNYVEAFSYSSTLPFPELGQLITAPQVKLETDATWITTFSSPLYKLTVRALINNDNDFDLSTGDLTVTVSKSDGTIVATTTMPDNIIQGIGCTSTATLTNWIELKADEIGRVPFYVTVSAKIDVGMQGVNEKCPLNGSMEFRIIPQDWQLGKK